MRRRRIKTAPEEGEAVYHCVSRTVNGERLFAEADREHLRRQIWLVAEYCGVQVLTYTILSNHFHVLVRVPKKVPIADEELLRRYQLLYPKPTKYQTARLEVIESQLSTNGPEAVQWRTRQLRLMGDVSNYLKLVKQRFSIGFNKRHKRFGTLWCERFKSIMVEPGTALRVIAAYIDLNCIRAGLSEDPKDYRFCTYAEAVAGKSEARAGISWVLGERWQKAAPEYRLLLFGTGADPFSHRRRISEAALDKVLKEGGSVPLPALLRCRIRYFIDSGILGSKSFVQSVAQSCQLKVRESPPALIFSEAFSGLHMARNARKSRI